MPKKGWRPLAGPADGDRPIMGAAKTRGGAEVGTPHLVATPAPATARAAERSRPRISLIKAPRLASASSGPPAAPAAPATAAVPAG